MSREVRAEVVRRWTLLKAAVLLSTLVGVGAQTLSLRQRRLDAASAMLRAHEELLEAQWAATSLEAEIAQRTTPERLERLAHGLQLAPVAIESALDDAPQDEPPTATVAQADDATVLEDAR